MTNDHTLLMEIHLCTFNGSRTLPKTLDSLIGQLNASIKLAILDDASTDNSRDIVYEMLSNVPSSLYRIACFDNNMGLACAKNALAETSSAKYLAYIDDDDISIRDRFSLQLEFLLANPSVDVLGGFAYQMTSNYLNKFNPPDLSKSRLLRRPTSHHQILKSLWRNPFIHPTVAIKRSTLLNVGGYNPELRTSQDYELWFRLSVANACFRNLDIPLIIYRKTSVKKYKPISYLRTLNIARVFLGDRGFASRVKLLIMTMRVYFKIFVCFTYNLLLKRS